MSVVNFKSQATLEPIGRVAPVAKGEVVIVTCCHQATC